MKKTLFAVLILTSMLSYMVANVHPVISLRYNDITGGDDLNTMTTTHVIGLEMELEDGIRGGFDSGDDGETRIYISNTYGTLGLGMDSNGDPQFTVGASYMALGNLKVSLDYIINNLTLTIDNTDDGIDNPDAPGPNTLRLSMGIIF